MLIALSNHRLSIEILFLCTPVRKQLK